MRETTQISHPIRPPNESNRTILHLFADTGIEDEILSTYGDVVRVGINPTENPFSTVIQSDARDPALSGDFNLAVAHPQCQKFSRSTNGTGNPDEYENQIPDARSVCKKLADHYIIENVPQAPLRSPVVFNGGMFGLPIHYPRAFETSFKIPQPDESPRFKPNEGPLSEQGEKGKAWVGTTEGWRLAKGYNYDWPGRNLKRHGIPAAYIKRLIYWWLTAVENNSRSIQTAITNGQY